MGERVPQLDVYSHNAREGDVVDNDVLCSQRLQGTSEYYGEHDLRIDFVCGFTRCEVGRVIRCERDFPVHDYGFAVCVRVRSNEFDARGFCTKSEMRQAHGVKYGRRAVAQGLINAGNDSRRQDWLVNEPKFLEEIVHPVNGFVINEQSLFGQHSRNVVASARAHPSAGILIVCRADRQNDHKPAARAATALVQARMAQRDAPFAQAEHCHKM